MYYEDEVDPTISELDARLAPYGEPDWITQNRDDGQIFFGYDRKDENTTDWWSKDGTDEGSSPIPTEESDGHNLYDGYLIDVSGHDL